jgi:hypothetical protein
LIVLGLLICSTNLGAQITIEGVVRDSLTNAALQYVIVAEVNGEDEDVTDGRGRFKVVVKSLPVELFVRIIGHETKRVVVSNAAFLTIQLSPMNFILGQIEISAESVNRVAGNERRSIWDYTWLGNEILMTEYGTSLSKSRVLLMNVYGDTIAQTNSPDRPVSMFTDCNGYAYLMSTDSLWQFYFDHGDLKRYPAESAALADRVLRYCVGQNDESIYFAVPSGRELRLGDDPYAFRYKTNNDQMRYFRFDRQTEKLMLMESVADEFVKNLKKDEVEYGNGPQPKKMTGSAFSEAASKHFFWTIMCPEIDAPMYYVADSLYVLDHTANRMLVISEEGKISREVNVSYHLDPNYQRASLTDIAGERLFAIFENSGIITLKQLDLATGEPISEFKIPHPFPEHISVSGDWLYYLCRDEKVHEARVLNRLKLTQAGN